MNISQSVQDYIDFGLEKADQIYTNIKGGLLVPPYKAREALQHLENVWKMGVYSEQVVMAQSKLYTLYGHFVHSAFVIERYADLIEDADTIHRLKIRSMRDYQQGGRDEDALRCYQESLNIVSHKVSADQKLIILCPLMGKAYANTGQSELGLKSLESMKAELGDRMGFFHSYSYYWLQITIWEIEDRLEKIKNIERQFANYISNLDVKSRLLNWPDDPVPESWIGFCLVRFKLKVLSAEFRLNVDFKQTIDSLLAQIVQYRTTCLKKIEEKSDKAGMWSKRYVKALTHVAIELVAVGAYPEAFKIFKQIENLKGELWTWGRLHYSSILVQMGQVTEALSILKEITGPLVVRGDTRACCSRLPAFDPIRNSVEFQSILEEWQSQELDLQKNKTKGKQNDIFIRTTTV